jgi:hypothetical protein
MRGGAKQTDVWMYMHGTAARLRQRPRGLRRAHLLLVQVHLACLAALRARQAAQPAWRGAGGTRERLPSTAPRNAVAAGGETCPFQMSSSQLPLMPSAWRSALSAMATVSGGLAAGRWGVECASGQGGGKAAGARGPNEHLNSAVSAISAGAHRAT